MKQSFTQQEEDVLCEATTYAEVASIALRQMERLALVGAPQPHYEWVCGPITTGGLGSIRANLDRFEEAITTLQQDGRHVFSQMPYEPKLQSLWETVLTKTEGYDYTLLEGFYGPVFDSGMIKCLHFIPGWQASTGAQWEHSYARRVGIKISHLGYDLLPLR